MQQEGAGLKPHQLLGRSADFGEFTLYISHSPVPLCHEWQALEKSAITTLFQTYDWVASWCASAAAAEGEDPLIVIGRDRRGKLAFILPFAVRKQLGAYHLTWLAQGHSGYGFGVYRPDCIAGLDGQVLRDIMHSVCQKVPRIAGVCLAKQPETWYGQANPFVALPRRRCRDEVFALKLQPDFEALYREFVTARTRKNDRRKLRKLQSAGRVVFEILQDSRRRLRCFDTLIAQKSAQLTGLPENNGLAAPHIRAFYRQWMGSENSNSQVQLATLTVDGQLIAIDLCARFQATAYALNGSMANCSYRDFSPGRMLYLFVIEKLCQDGVAVLDLGPGLFEYKQHFGASSVSLFNSIYPVRSGGRLSSAAVAAAAEARPAVLSLARKHPRLGHGLFGIYRMCRSVLSPSYNTRIRCFTLLPLIQAHV